MTTEAPNTPLPADHAEVVRRLQKYRGWPDTPEQQALVTDALALISSQAEEIERITKEKDEAVAFSDSTLDLAKRSCSDAISRAKAAESSLASMTERCKELEEALGRCDELFALIRCDWSDPRSECREGRAIIARALSQTTKGEKS